MVTDRRRQSQSRFGRGKRHVQAFVTRLALGILFVSFGIANVARGQEAGRERTVTMMLDYLATGYHAPYFYGVNLGIFKKHGIDLKITPGTGSGNTIQVVATNQSMFGQADVATVIVAASKGITGPTVVYQYLQSFGVGVMVKAGSGIMKPDDIAGHSVGNVVGAVTAQMFPLLMSKVGVPMDKVKLINTTPATFVAAFLRGEFDVAPTVVYDSYALLTDAGNDLRLLLYRDYGINILSSAVIASAEVVKDRKLVKDFTDALTESIAAARANPQAAAEANKAVNPTTAAVPTQVKQITAALDLTSRPSSAGRPAGYASKDDWEETVKILRDAGLISSADIDVGKLFDSSFVDSSR
jgi:NitT/TauT family transport system substrate-binding protein